MLTLLIERQTIELLSLDERMNQIDEAIEDSAILAQIW